MRPERMGVQPKIHDGLSILFIMLPKDNEEGSGLGWDAIEA